MGNRIAASRIKLKRAYEPAIAADGRRILVDRLWPRGLTKSAARIDDWTKELAPSPELRRWFAHDPARWPEFRKRYAKELAEHREELEHLRTRARQGPITLVYAARDETHNNAVVLRHVLLGR
jgi:uncharacterized protein YeaO (DUF488 family)